MLIHEFGDKRKPVMILLHGMFTPWEIWEEHIKAFEKDYRVIVPALKGHIENDFSDFVTVEEEAAELEAYCKLNGIDNIFALCGISLGGDVAFEIWKNGKIGISYLILDGAALVGQQMFMEKMMLSHFLDLLNKTKKRDEKTLELVRKRMVPDKYMDKYISIVFDITEESVKNLVHAVCRDRIDKNVINNSRILFMYGTEGEGAASAKKSAKLLKKYFPEAELQCNSGDTNGYRAVFTPKLWIKDVTYFLKSR